MIILKEGQQFNYCSGVDEIVVFFVEMREDEFVFQDDLGKTYSFTRDDFYDKKLTPYATGANRNYSRIDQELRQEVSAYIHDNLIRSRTDHTERPEDAHGAVQLPNDRTCLLRAFSPNKPHKTPVIRYMKGAVDEFQQEGYDDDADCSEFAQTEDIDFTADVVSSDHYMQSTKGFGSVSGELTIDPKVIQKEESFSEMLLRLIDEKGMSDPDAYHKAWVDRRVFSKIRSNPDYTPLKRTAVAFALALELDKANTDELLMKAGYALSNSSEWDLIIRFCIEHSIYRLYDVNSILNDFGQPLFS